MLLKERFTQKMKIMLSSNYCKLLWLIYVKAQKERLSDIYVLLFSIKSEQWTIAFK